MHTSLHRLVCADEIGRLVEPVGHKLLLDVLLEELHVDSCVDQLALQLSAQLTIKVSGPREQFIFRRAIYDVLSMTAKEEASSADRRSLLDQFQVIYDPNLELYSDANRPLYSNHPIRCSLVKVSHYILQ